MTLPDDRREAFLRDLADILEVPSVALETDYRTVPLWGSLTCFSLKVMLQQRYGRTLPLAELAAFPTVAALAESVFA